MAAISPAATLIGAVGTLPPGWDLVEVDRGGEIEREHAVVEVVGQEMFDSIGQLPTALARVDACRLLTVRCSASISVRSSLLKLHVPHSV